MYPHTSSTHLSSVAFYSVAAASLEAAALHRASCTTNRPTSSYLRTYLHATSILGRLTFLFRSLIHHEWTLDENGLNKLSKSMKNMRSALSDYFTYKGKFPQLNILVLIKRQCHWLLAFRPLRQLDKSDKRPSQFPLNAGHTLLRS